MSDKNEQTISVTDSALNQINTLLASNGKTLLKIGVKKSGCSGFMYFMDFCEAIANDEQIIFDDGFQILCKKTDFERIKGVKLDYISEGINKSFKFSNTEATGKCGCGESFSFT